MAIQNEFEVYVKRDQQWVKLNLSVIESPEEQIIRIEKKIKWMTEDILELVEKGGTLKDKGKSEPLHENQKKKI